MAKSKSKKPVMKGAAAPFGGKGATSGAKDAMKKGAAKAGAGKRAGY